MVNPVQLFSLFGTGGPSAGSTYIEVVLNLQSAMSDQAVFTRCLGREVVMLAGLSGTDAWALCVSASSYRAAL